MQNVTVTNEIYCSAPCVDEIIAVSPTGASVDVIAAETRTISGLVLPYGEEGRTASGTLMFSRDSISLPANLSNVKLLAGHSPDGEIIGHATSATQGDDGLRMTFQLGSGALADAVLASAREKLADALSIEATDVSRQGMHVQSSLLKAVAVVRFPAFPSARITEVHGEDAAQSPSPPRSSVVPTALAPTPAAETHASLDEVIDILCAARSGELTSAEVHAKLTDITYSSMTTALAPDWLGELWSGVPYQRQVIPRLTQKPLRGMKAKGFRWKTKPKVEKYSGDKTDVPTSSVTVEAVDIAAQRWAHANDIDRAFYDFNDREILASYWRMVAESYAMETDMDTTKWLLEQANEAGQEKDILRAVAAAGLQIADKVKEPATFALVNPVDIKKILDVSELDAPKFLELVPLAADPKKWVLSSEITAGTVVVGTKSAAEFYELPGSPLRVEAEHLAHGGRDAALFGYTAHNVVKPDGLLKVTITPGG